MIRERDPKNIFVLIHTVVSSFHRMSKKKFSPQASLTLHIKTMQVQQSVLEICKTQRNSDRVKDTCVEDTCVKDTYGGGGARFEGFFLSDRNVFDAFAFLK